MFGRNDFTAFGALCAAYDLGLRVPRDVAVAGFDNLPLAAYTTPPLTTIEQVVRAYDIRWVVLERDDAVPAVAPILDGSRPAWLGAPVLTLEPVRTTGASSRTPSDAPGLALYPVCSSAGDARCSATTAAVP